MADRLVERFLAKVKKTDGCWIWCGHIGSGGYGRFQLRGTNRYAHRVSYELFVGDLGDALVCHTCDNPCCVRPDHLFLGTHRDNKLDAIRKGRHAAGERHGNAKLSDDQVRELRCLYVAGSYSYAELGRRFGMTDRGVSLIVRRKTRAQVLA